MDSAAENENYSGRDPVQLHSLIFTRYNKIKSALQCMHPQQQTHPSSQNAVSPNKRRRPNSAESRDASNDTDGNMPSASMSIDDHVPSYGDGDLDY